MDKIILLKALIAFIIGGVLFYILSRFIVRKYCKYMYKIVDNPDDNKISDILFGKKNVIKYDMDGYENVSGKLFIILGAVSCAVCYLSYGFNVQMIIVFLFLCILDIIAFIDLYSNIVPYGYLLVILLLGVFSLIYMEEITLFSRILGLLCISTPLVVSNFIIKDPFSWGDIWLIAVCGFYFGWENLIFAVFISVVAVAFYCIYLLISKNYKKENGIAFGPFLCIGMSISAISQDYIVYYMREFMFELFDSINYYILG